jgi:ribonuclease HI
LLKSRAGRVKFSWVKGHAGHPLNEAADRLANVGAVKYGKARTRI